jgi:hypothetical protein
MIPPVMAQFLASDLWHHDFWHWSCSNSFCIASNCLQIVIFCILYAWHWHIWTPHNNFWGMMISVMSIPCLHQHCEFWHWSCFKSSHTASNCLQILILCILYAWRWHIWTPDNNFWWMIMQITFISLFHGGFSCGLTCSWITTQIKR